MFLSPVTKTKARHKRPVARLWYYECEYCDFALNFVSATNGIWKAMPRYSKTCLAIGSLMTAGLFSTLVVAASPPPSPAHPPAVENGGETAFRQDIQPLLKKYCYACHADGAKSGNVAFDDIKSYAELRQDHKLFQKVLKNVRGGIMPPLQMEQPTDAEKQRLAQWIKTYVYRINPASPDPGRVTVRRLNRAEYRNTVRDLLGVDYDTQTEFPPDDAGHGFDNIGDVLTLSPMLMEKYLNAAQAIVSQAVPTASKVVAENEILGARFVPETVSVPVSKTDDKAAVATEKAAVATEKAAVPASSTGDKAAAPTEKAAAADKTTAPAGKPAAPAPAPTDFRVLSYYTPAVVSCALPVAHTGGYQLLLDLSANERYVDDQFDYNKCRLIIRADGQELFRQDFNREGGKHLQYTFDQKWQAGQHKLSFEVQPLTPGAEQIRALTLRINKVTVRGPLDARQYVEPRNYRAFFPHPAPAASVARRAYAHQLLGDFARRAFRRPVDDKTLSRLTALAESVYTQPGQTFEAGVAQAMVAVLASPRFLFREEGVGIRQDASAYALVDEYALASRLSYFLWSSMPDDELFRLAAQGQLRKNLDAQVQRMLRDRRADALVQNFSGQWLQTRDIAKVPINPFAVLAREADPAANAAAGNRRRNFNGPRVRFDDALRADLKQEADSYFGYVTRENRSVLELIDSDYTFLNARLAQYYGVADAGVTGQEFRKVTLPANSPRGGMLTMASVLAVTSNPTRTSPVKRGLFILDNVLGAPAPPPPPNIPPLEAATTGAKNSKPTLREALAAHRSKPECVSCHQRLDPPGLALENFNAMGLWREKEYGQPIDPGGTLVTGEAFKDVRELKHILATRHSTEFYRCLTEKLMTYALGRGLEDYDVEAVDRIVKRLEQDKGRFSTLLTGVIESAPFQKCRNTSASMVASVPRQTPLLAAEKSVAVRSSH